MTATYALAVLLLTSISWNIILSLKLRRKLKQPAPTFDAKQLLHDILKRDSALVRVHVLDPEGLFMTKSGR